MAYFNSDADTSLVTQSGNIRVLGETGQTVVYLFPDGRALPEREPPDFDALGGQMSNSMPLQADTLDDLVAQGKMSAAQKAVVLHDQEITGMSIVEILTARGWV
jgi:hypothetical protein